MMTKKFIVSTLILISFILSSKASEIMLSFDDYRSFKNSWKLPSEHHTDFLQYLKTEEIAMDTVYTDEEIEILTLRIKAEIASVIWGRNEATGVHLKEDNQVQEGIKYFDEASVFINHSF